jgi:16S rRNA (guanine527-N7)-methyltransferase
VKRCTALPQAVRATLERYCDLLAAAGQSLTAVPPEQCWERHVQDALRALPLLERLGPAVAVDVGSGNGSPGIPLAVVAGVETVLLEARRPRVRFLEAAVVELEAPCRVLHGRSEEHARGAGRDAYDVVLARALAPPPVAAELCLPLVRPGGRAVLWTGAADLASVSAVCAQLGAALVAEHRAGGARRLLELTKLAPTPERFPRRPGMAAKRPLASLPSST